MSFNELSFVWPEDDSRWNFVCQPQYIDGLMIGFDGELGAGKSSLIRHWLRLMGVEGVIRSPTYTLCECYQPVGHCKIVHIDAYRLQPDDGLGMLGLDLLDNEKHSLWIEWCSLQPYYYMRCDLFIQIVICESAIMRSYTVKSQSAAGDSFIEQLAIALESSAIATNF